MPLVAAVGLPDAAATTGVAAALVEEWEVLAAAAASAAAEVDEVEAEEDEEETETPAAAQMSLLTERVLAWSAAEQPELTQLVRDEA